MDTITTQDFRLLSCQATLFTPNAEVSIVKLVQELLPQWVALFDMDPTIVSTADDLPPEMPRLLLKSQSHMWHCQIAPARIDLFWRKSRMADADIQLKDFFREACQRLNEYARVLGTQVGRLAAVLNRYADHPTPGTFIAQHFCQDRWLTGPLAQVEGCEFHVNQRLMLADHYRVNYWIRSKTGRMTSGEENRAAVWVEQDINTLSEDLMTERFTSANIEEFFFATATQFDESLQYYYPPEGSR